MFIVKKVIIVIIVVSLALMYLLMFKQLRFSGPKDQPIELPYLTESEISSLASAFDLKFPSDINEIRVFLLDDDWLSGLYCRVEFSKRDLNEFMDRGAWEPVSMFHDSAIELMIMPPMVVPWVVSIWDSASPLPWWNPQKDRIIWALSESYSQDSDIQMDMFIEECDNGTYRAYLNSMGGTESCPKEVIGSNGLLNPMKEGWQERKWLPANETSK